MDETKKLELKRQSFHLTVGLIIALIVFFYDKIFVLAAIVFAVIFMVFLPENKLFRFLLKEFEREGRRFNGAIFFCAGIIFPILFLDKTTCAVIIAVFSFGDSASTIAGKFFGRHKYKIFYERSLEGSLAFILSGFIGGLIFCASPLFSLEMAFFGALIEILAFADDNLLIPLFLVIIVLLQNTYF